MRQTGRLEAGDFREAYFRTPNCITLPAMLESIVMQTELSSLQRSVSVRIAAPPEPVVIPVHTEHLENILYRLTDNAVKFSPEGSSVQLSADVTADAVEFAVTDQGPGIPPESFPKVFTKFWQLGREVHEQQGLGLGLFIAKQLTESYGGRIRFQNESGTGMTFRVSMPLHRSPADPVVTG